MRKGHPVNERNDRARLAHEREARKYISVPKRNRSHVTVNLPRELAEALDAECREKNMARSALLRAMIKGYIGQVRLMRHHN